MAAIIASQAVISGVFSLTRQAIQLGYLPRMEIRHTSETEIGQIYVPRVNWILMAGIIALVVGFGSSDKLAGAYGLAVTGAMLVDAALAMAVAILVWKWKWPAGCGRCSAFLAIPDVAFFIANALKIPEGGWLPLIVAGLSSSPSRPGGAAASWSAPSWPRARCRCRSSSTAWSARPIASPARRCS